MNVFYVLFLTSLISAQIMYNKFILSPVFVRHVQSLPVTFSTFNSTCIESNCNETCETLFIDEHFTVPSEWIALFARCPSQQVYINRVELAGDNGNAARLCYEEYWALFANRSIYYASNSFFDRQYYSSPYKMQIEGETPSAIRNLVLTIVNIIIIVSSLFAFAYITRLLYSLYLLSTKKRAKLLITELVYLAVILTLSIVRILPWYLNGLYDQCNLMTTTVTFFVAIHFLTYNIPLLQYGILYHELLKDKLTKVNDKLASYTKTLILGLILFALALVGALFIFTISDTILAITFVILFCIFSTLAILLFFMVRLLQTIAKIVHYTQQKPLKLLKRMLFRYLIILALLCLFIVGLILLVSTLGHIYLHHISYLLIYLPAIVQDIIYVSDFVRSPIATSTTNKSGSI